MFKVGDKVRYKKLTEKEFYEKKCADYVDDYNTYSIACDIYFDKNEILEILEIDTKFNTYKIFHKKRNKYFWHSKNELQFAYDIKTKINFVKELISND